jgi:hypothetical protein
MVVACAVDGAGEAGWPFPLGIGGIAFLNQVAAHVKGPLRVKLTGFGLPIAALNLLVPACSQVEPPAFSDTSSSSGIPWGAESSPDPDQFLPPARVGPAV